MKIKKKKYIKYRNYLRKINKHKLDDLQLKGFPGFTKEVQKQFEFTGLNTCDFLNILLKRGGKLLADLYERRELKR